MKVIGICKSPTPPYYANLPFEDHYFDLIINRHSAYTPRELARILKTGGLYITQQVGTLTGSNLKFLLSGGRERRLNDWNLKSASTELQNLGFKIEFSMENLGYIRFYDIGAVTYYLMSVPWMLPGFNVEDYRQPLQYLHQQITQRGFYDMLFESFIIRAQTT
jgi:SAM-dependent methyltransferase